MWPVWRAGRAWGLGSAGRSGRRESWEGLWARERGRRVRGGAEQQGLWEPRRGGGEGGGASRVTPTWLGMLGEHLCPGPKLGTGT